ncbi:amidohydrolase [Paenibacillus anaericanus]|uniref:Amidohydrolase n=1 Tax=Paenibacillus anaericanus TaxID=170367 RepID=A0A433Y7I5_9BACL|nr:amidohydrolase [Paenibacillus anaericanus]RUT45354.1 amidohydrolase [Paenibacillus anaericanus]
MSEWCIAEEIKKHTDMLIQWRRYLHQHPELSFKEFDTAQYIVAQIEDMNLPVVITRPTPTSVVVHLDGAREGSTILLRADIDALPIQEDNDLAFKSVKDGIMHACGHDAHTAILLGVLKILGEHAKQIKGTILFVFQAAEEVGGGARELIRTGILQNVDQAYAIHVSPSIPIGQYGIGYGALMAAGEAFDVEILGSGGHAAKPEEANDPINVAIQAITAAKQLLERKTDPLQPKLMSVTYFNAGRNNNVISQQAKFGGTLRTLDVNLLQEVKAHLVQTLKHVTALYGADFHIRFETDGLPPEEPPSQALFNDYQTTRLAASAIENHLSKDRITTVQPSLTGEDFAFISALVPATMVFVGTRNEALDAVYPLHHPKFRIDEAVLENGVAYFLSLVTELAVLEQPVTTQ